jgi:hypothetical protein
MTSVLPAMSIVEDAQPEKICPEWHKRERNHFIRCGPAHTEKPGTATLLNNWKQARDKKDTWGSDTR